MYPPNVERWRAQVVKTFGPDEADKWLHLINGESGGNPQITGDGGAAHGLFQSHYIGGSASIDQQFADAKRLHDADLKNGGTGFGDWGEGRLYEGKKFGALGNNPYSGGQALNARGPIDYGDVNPVVSKKPSIIDILHSRGKKDSGSQYPPTFRTGVEVKDRPVSQTLAKSGGTGSGQDFGTYSSKDFKPDLTFGSLRKSISATPFNHASNKILFDQPHPAGAFAGLLKGQDFDTQYWTLIQKQLDIMDKYDAEIAKGENADPTLLAQLESQIGLVSDALGALDKARDAGLVTTGVDAAKAYITSETGKQDAAAKNYADYSGRVNDLTALGKLGTDAFKTIQSAETTATNNNAGRFKETMAGTLPRTTPYDLVRAGTPTLNIQQYMDSIQKTIPAQAPAGYSANPAAYDQWLDEIKKRRTIGNVLGGSTQGPAGSSIYGAINPEGPGF